MEAIEEYIDPFKNYLELNENLSILTKDKYVSCVRKFLLECGQSLTMKKINEYVKKKAQQDKYAIKKFFISIDKQHIADKLVTPRKKNRERDYKYIPKEKINRLVNFLTGKYKYMAFFQYKTGCRVHEVLTLRIEYFDFDKDDQVIHIDIGGGKSLTKGNKKRTIMLYKGKNKEYERLVRRLFRGRTFGYLFLNEGAEFLKGKPLVNVVENQRRYYNIALGKAGKYFSIERFSSHYFRHLFADEFRKKNKDITYLKDVLGHSKLDTTLTYVSITHDQARNGIILMEE